MLCLSLLMSCSTPVKQQDNRLSILSYDYKFIDELLYGYVKHAREIDVWLTLPDQKNLAHLILR